jgi:hypothetical protein
MVILYKSCSVLHKQSKKLSLHFSEFSTIFYELYKVQQNYYTIKDSVLYRGPWKS